MSALVFLPVILVAAGLAARRWYVWAHRDARSIEAHRSTLDLLEHVTSEGEHPVDQRDPAPHVRVVGEKGLPRPSRPGPKSIRSPRPVEDPTRPRRRVVFVDDSARDGSGAVAPAAPAVPAAPAALAAPAVPAAPAVAAAPAATAVRRPPRVPRILVMGAAAAAVIVIAVAVALAAHGSGGKAPHRSAQGGTHPTSPPVTRPAPTTTLAPPPAVTAVSTGATEATYTARTSTVQVSLAVTRACWVELRSQSINGPMVYEGVLQPGQSQTFQAVGGLWLRLGNPAGVAVHLNGEALSLPTAANPYNVSVSIGA